MISNSFMPSNQTDHGVLEFPHQVDGREERSAALGVQKCSEIVMVSNFVMIFISYLGLIVHPMFSNGFLES